MPSVLKWVVLAGVLIAASTFVAWSVSDGFYFGPRPYHSCNGDPATCAAAAQHVIDHWPEVAPWDDTVGALRVGDVMWIECDHIDPDINTCYLVMVFDPYHYGDPVYVHFPDGYSNDGRAEGNRIEVLPPQS